MPPKYKKKDPEKEVDKPQPDTKPKYEEKEEPVKKPKYVLKYREKNEKQEEASLSLTSSTISAAKYIGK